MFQLKFSAALAALLVAGSAVAQTAAAPVAAPVAPVAPAPAVAPAAVSAPAPVAASAKAMAAPADASEGKIAWYGRKFNGRKTANGERFNAGKMTMSHKSLPFGTRVKLTNLGNQRSVVVRVNDRGPSTPDRVGDVTQAAATKLRMRRNGTAQVKLEVLGQAGPGKAMRKARRK
jgi:rare lipoprotein A